MDTTLVKQMIGAESGGNFSQVTIGLASPEVITSWSRGEIKNPEKNLPRAMMVEIRANNKMALSTAPPSKAFTH